METKSASPKEESKKLDVLFYSHTDPRGVGPRCLRLISNISRSHFFKGLFVIIVVVSLVLNGCGSSNASTEDALAKSQLVKTWICKDCGVSDTITITSSGTLTSSYCSADAKITTVTPDASCPDGAATCGIIKGTVNTSNGKTGCVAKGDITCSYVTYSIYLTWNCTGKTADSHTYYFE